MTDSPQTDPRLDAATKALVRYQSNGLCDENYPEQCLDCDCFHAQTKAAKGHGFKRELEQVQAVLAAADAADEASGVRRVTAQEWRVVWRDGEPGQRESATSKAAATALAEQLRHIVGDSVRIESRAVGEWSTSAADSPVGGMS